MRKILPIFLILMVGLSMAAEVTVTRTMPGTAEPGSTLEVKFDIFPSATVSGFDLADLIPRNWEVQGWSVTGVDKSEVEFDTKAQSYNDKVYMANHWEFPDLSAGATLTYTVKLPSPEGSYGFVGIWTYPGGFKTDEKALTIAKGVPPECGDGSCNGGEDCTSCPSDCGDCVTEPACGDGSCNGGEDCTSCPSDCGECEKEEPDAPEVPMWVYGIILLVILAGAYYYFANQNQGKKSGPKYSVVKKLKLD